MERLAQIIAILDDAEQVEALSSDELATMQTELLALAEKFLAGEELPTEGASVVDALSQIADYAAPADGGIAYVLAVRTEAAEATATAIEEQRTRLGLVPQVEGESAPETAVEAAPAVAEVAPAPEALATEVPAPEAAPVVAAAPAAPAPAALPSTAEMAASAPRVEVGADRLMEAVETGESIDLDGLVKLAIDKFERFQGMSGLGSEFVPLARMRVDYDDAASLDNARSNDARVNAKLSALVDNAWEPDRWNDALVASGGFCAPAQPDYDMPQISGTQRPVKSSLNRVGMDRGSVTVIQPPRLVDVTTSTAQVASSAVSVWTNAIDTTPGGATKPVQTVACPTPLTVTLQAIVEQLQFGNFEARAFPELIKTVMANTASAWARRAEGQLLSQIDAASTAVTTPQVLGATGDFLGYLGRLSAAVRNRNRMDPNAKLRLMLPRWFVDFIASDLAHQHAGDGLERYTIGEPEVRAILASRNVNVTFYEDQSDRAGATAQIFGVQGATAVRHWPPGLGVANPNVVWYLFPEGTHSVGDGGTLDLGIVRDSTLNNTNDYRFFTESWEVIIPKVIESWKVTSTLCDSGAGQIDAAGTYCGTS